MAWPWKEVDESKQAMNFLSDILDNIKQVIYTIIIVLMKKENIILTCGKTMHGKILNNIPEY